MFNLTHHYRNANQNCRDISNLYNVQSPGCIPQTNIILYVNSNWKNDYIFLKNLKTTVQYYLTPIRRDPIKRTENNTWWWKCRGIGILVHCWWECKLVQLPWKTVWCFLIILKLKLPYDSEILLLGYNQKNWKQKFEEMFVHLCSQHHYPQ